MPNQSKWVPTRLRLNDRLGGGPDDHDLSKLFHVTPREIAAQNGTTFTTAAVNEWVVRTGGELMPTGVTRFTDDSVILLPANGPRQMVNVVPDSPINKWWIGGVSLVLLIGGGFLVYHFTRKKAGPLP